MRICTRPICWTTCLLGTMLIVGCAGDSSIEEPAAEPAAVSSKPASPPPAAPPMGAGATAVSQPDSPPAAEEPEATAVSQPESPPAAEEPEASQTVKAKTGVGKRGRGYGGGMISEPVRAYFRTRQRISFIQMEKGMREFKAINGRAPESHEEFMEKIIKEYGVDLPELPEGQSYFYDLELEELMVRKPVR